MKAAIISCSLLLLAAGCATQKTYDLTGGKTSDPSGVVRFVVPMEFNILSVDGKDFGHSLHLGPLNRQTVLLNPGQHVIRIRYYAAQDDGMERGETAMWHLGPFTVPLRGEAGKVYTLSFSQPMDMFDEELDLKVIEMDAQGIPVPAPPAEPVAKQPPLPPTPSAVEILIPSRGNTTASPLINLQKWWSVASENDRKEFLLSIDQDTR